jgi:hypothetical protein
MDNEPCLLTHIDKSINSSLNHRKMSHSLLDNRDLAWKMWRFSAISEKESTGSYIGMVSLHITAPQNYSLGTGFHPPIQCIFPHND